MSVRQASRKRATRETSIEVELVVDGRGQTDVDTGLPFFDHMLDQLGRHGGFDLTVHAQGDLAVDSHHTVEDVAITLGETLREALGDKAGVRRFASGIHPRRGAGRGGPRPVGPALRGLRRAAFGEVLPLGDPPFNPELVEHFFHSFATSAALTLHVTKRAGRNTHHVVEATFKGVARCLRDAVRVEGDAIPSTKGAL
jgi:imidazoleglycerol-phosphate dehydratase